MKYAIHKSLNITAKDIDDSINECREINGVEVSIYRDGCIIAEPSNTDTKGWSRNKDDYRIETINPSSGETVYSGVKLVNDKLIFVK